MFEKPPLDKELIDKLCVKYGLEKKSDEQLNIEKKITEYMDNEKIRNIGILVYGGSIAHGTNNENSDIDLRGIIFNTEKEILSFKTDDKPIVIKNENDDITLYYLKQAITLLSNCNPSMIELVGCKKEHYLILSEKGQLLIDNRKIFLSKKAINTFGGYANNLLKKLELKESKHRNNKITTDKLNKHMMHLIRLYYMSFDIMDNMEIITYRENEIPLLTEIRNGNLSMSEIFSLQKELEIKFNEKSKKTLLPDKPDYQKIDELVIKINSYDYMEFVEVDGRKYYITGNTQSYNALN